MPTITCFLAAFNLRPTSPPIGALTLGQKDIAGYLATALANAGIGFALDWSRRNRLPGLVEAGGVTSADLAQGLAALLGADAGNPDCVGLLLANALDPNYGQFGMMFDIYGQNGTYGPRQGCAVFLDNIAGAVPAGGEPYEDFVTFTAIHELGHLFNLWHLPGSGTFMEPFPNPAALGSCTFAPTQVAFLDLAASPATASYVLPGQSPFGAWPPGVGDPGETPFAEPEGTPGALALDIVLSHSEFWPFEPLELELELRLANAAGGPVEAPDEIDPGYSTFQIMVTKPSGERFLFRPEASFCGRNGAVAITASQPKRRDVAIFWHANAYAFGAPGEYAVQAALRLRSGEVVRSNIATCLVRAPDPAADGWRAVAAALGTRDVQLFLMRKNGPPSQYDYGRLVAFADEVAGPETAATIHYALGKTWKRRADQLSDSMEQSELNRLAVTHLGNALRTGGLSEHRTEKARRLTGVEPWDTSSQPVNGANAKIHGEQPPPAGAENPHSGF